MSDKTKQEEVRKRINEIKDNLVGRNRTHQQVAKHSGWSSAELENVIKEDGWIYEDEMIALINSEVTSVLDDLEKTCEYCEGTGFYDVYSGEKYAEPEKEPCEEEIHYVVKSIRSRYE